MILEIEQECLSVYQKKIDDARISRVQLQRAIALSEAEIADICLSLGEQPVHVSAFRIDEPNLHVVLFQLMLQFIQSHFLVC